MKARRGPARALVRWAIWCGAALAVVGVHAGPAYADEEHTHSDNGPRVALIHIGQIDDPLEDVLEHAALLGTTYVFD
ncbi:hypothetical protein [Streptomyces pratensis]|uniref:hypothetical protein n=1 Tax=Streptomyces pratensis TaxID=1169025 RepID=UPI003018D77D